MRSDHLAKHVKTHENKVKKTSKKVKDDETTDKEKPQPKIVKTEEQIPYLTPNEKVEPLAYQTPYPSSNFVHPTGAYQKLYNPCYEQNQLDSSDSVTSANPNEAQIYHINTEVNQNYQRSPMMYNYSDNQHLMMNYMMDQHALGGDVLYK